MKIVVAALFLIVLCIVPASAQVQEIEAHTGAVSCGTCFSAALVGVKQVDGVTDASGDMREGWIRISVNPKSGVSLKEVTERIRLAGFKDSAQFSITASGTFEQRGNRLVLVVPNQAEVFVVDPGDREKMAMNAAASREAVRVTGQISGGGKQYELKVGKLQKQ